MLRAQAEGAALYKLSSMLKRIATAIVLIPIVMLLVLRAPVPVVAGSGGGRGAHHGAGVSEEADRGLRRSASAPSNLHLRRPVISCCWRRAAAGETPQSRRTNLRPGAGIRLRPCSISLFKHHHASRGDEQCVSCGSGLGVRLPVYRRAHGNAWYAASTTSGQERSGCSTCTCWWFGRETSSLTLWDDPWGAI